MINHSKPPGRAVWAFWVILSALLCGMLGGLVVAQDNEEVDFSISADRCLKFPGYAVYYKNGGDTHLGEIAGRAPVSVLWIEESDRLPKGLSPLTSGGLAKLRQLKQLQEVIADTPIDDAVCGVVAEMPTVHSVTVCRVGPVGIRSLALNKGLKTLTVQCRFSKELANAASEIGSLTCLRLYEATPEGIRNLSSGRLEELDIRLEKGAKLTAEEVGYIPNAVPRVRRLTLSANLIDAGADCAAKARLSGALAGRVCFESEVSSKTLLDAEP